VLILGFYHRLLWTTLRLQSVLSGNSEHFYATYVVISPISITLHGREPGRGHAQTCRTHCREPGSATRFATRQSNGNWTLYAQRRVLEKV